MKLFKTACRLIMQELPLIIMSIILAFVTAYSCLKWIETGVDESREKAFIHQLKNEQKARENQEPIYISPADQVVIDLKEKP